MANELSSSATNKADSERRRKQAETALQEVSARLADIERAKSEMSDKMAKLQQEADAVNNQLEEADLKASAALKASATMETQLLEAQV